MGGGYYHEDVQVAQQAVSTTRSSEAAFAYHVEAAAGKAKGVHPSLNMHGKIRECRAGADHADPTPIAVVMDVTQSRGRDARVIYEQVPSFLGSLTLTRFVSSPQIMFAAVGDAYSDKAPVQMGQFESDRRMDDQLSCIWMEEGGGGSGEESYELLAYGLARKTELDATKQGKKGYAFFLGDEAPYSTVRPEFVKTYFGDTIGKELCTQKIFGELSKKFHPFLIFPRSSMNDRKVAIDAEIKQRLERLGGRFKDVSIRATLIWNDRNDLDLHCITPADEHIYYGARKARCGGELDVDRNVHGDDPKPVENIRWEKGTARKGWYVFYVELFRMWEHTGSEIPFRVETDIDGVIKTVEGKINSAHLNERGRVEVARFFYDPAEAGVSKADDHEAYRDEVILAKWARYIPEANILRVQDPASAVEVMLGVLALSSGKMNLDQFVASMRERGVNTTRQDDVRTALGTYAKTGVVASVDTDAFSD